MSESLELCDTESLLDELRRRYDACLFVGIKHTKEDVTDVKCRWHGRPFDCLALSSLVHDRILRKFSVGKEAT